MCRLDFLFQNLLFSEYVGKNCAVFVCTGGLSVTFFNRFLNVPDRVNEMSISNLSYKMYKNIDWPSSFVDQLKSV